MMRYTGEGDDPKTTVALGGDTYRSTGRLKVVIPWHPTRSGRVYTLLLVEKAWMYAGAKDADRDWDLIDKRVTVTWRLAYGRRYVRSLAATDAAKGAAPKPG
jgi:hypothetical protein